MKSNKDGCNWCPVHCPDSSRKVRPLQVKLGSQCCYHMYFVDCHGDIVDPPGVAYSGQARDEEGELVWAALDASFLRETDAAGDQYLNICLDANTEAIRQQFATVPGRCCKKSNDDKICYTLEFGWRDAEDKWSASCDIQWCVLEAVIDPDEPFTELPSPDICARIANCFGGITSPDNSITVGGNFQDGYELTVNNTCQGFTVNAGLTADVGDDSLGTAQLACGETLHFHAPDGNISVIEGSAIVRVDHPDFCALLDELGTTVPLDCAGLPSA